MEDVEPEIQNWFRGLAPIQHRDRSTQMAHLCDILLSIIPGENNQDFCPFLACLSQQRAVAANLGTCDRLPRARPNPETVCEPKRPVELWMS